MSLDSSGYNVKKARVKQHAVYNRSVPWDDLSIDCRMERGGCYRSNGTVDVKEKLADNVFRMKISQTLGTPRLDPKAHRQNFS